MGNVDAHMRRKDEFRVLLKFAARFHCPRPNFFCQSMCLFVIDHEAPRGLIWQGKDGCMGQGAAADDAAKIKAIVSRKGTKKKDVRSCWS